MHIFFSGIGGAGISSLAHIALDLGFKVSGSDLIFSPVMVDLEQRRVKIFMEQGQQSLSKYHLSEPVDWYIHTAALKPDHPELLTATKLGIKTGKRDEFINWVLQEKKLELVSVCGTHGKTTTTAMLVWLFKNFGIPISYLIGSSISFGNSGQYQQGSKFFIMEADEFDKNMLRYQQAVGVVPSLDYDHPDTYPTIEDYQSSFAKFLEKSSLLNLIYQDDLDKIKSFLKEEELKKVGILKKEDKPNFGYPKVIGLHNRQNAYLASSTFGFLATLCGIKKISLFEIEQIIKIFPGADRRMQKLAPNLYSDYAHHPVEIRAGLQMVKEFSKDVVVVYQPHQNIRQHQVQNEYLDCFQEAKKVYWLPTYLSREKEGLEVLSPEFLAGKLQNVEVEVVDLDLDLITKIKQHIAINDLVLVMGAGSVDGFIREKMGLNLN
jgi:UDP-N-acetylmuramate--alanine ligase